MCFSSIPIQEYCSILYLKPRMKIFLRQKKVETKLISKSLSRTETDVYKPSWLNVSFHGIGLSEYNFERDVN